MPTLLLSHSMVGFTVGEGEVVANSDILTQPACQRMKMVALTSLNQN